MQLGKGIKESAASKLASKVSANLANGEAILLVCRCNGFRPLIDRVIVTNQRLIALHSGDTKIKVALRLEDVASTSLDSGWATTSLSLTPADGVALVLKGMEREDAEVAQALVTAGEPARLDAPLATLTPLPSQGDGAMSPVAGAFARAKQAYTDVQAANQALDERNAASYGRLTKRASFGAHTVEIYESGHVRVGMFLTRKSPFEKLVSIRFTSQTQDKSAGGRALAAGATMGLSALTSNEKRVLFLTMATDRKIHTLQTEGTAGHREDKTGLALEAAGQAVLDASAPAATAAVPSPPPPTLAEQLTQLAALHASGVLSDDELASAKARLLTDH